ncbi:nuclear protein 1-like [Arapaima gigas]
MSFVNVEKLEPSTFEERYYDQYEYYNLTERYCGGASRKGRTKREASCNTNRPCPAGHERKIAEKLRRSERRSKQ